MIIKSRNCELKITKIVVNWWFLSYHLTIINIEKYALLNVHNKLFISGIVLVALYKFKLQVGRFRIFVSSFCSVLLALLRFAEI
jgi:hypothetical protein